MAQVPAEAFRRLVAMTREACPPRPVARDGVGAAASSSLADDGFVEEALRFGEGDRLFGVLCRPAGATDEGPLVVIVNVGRNAHTGWRRMGVENARRLARRGIASLRFDISGVGESAARPGQPKETLYSDWPLLDMIEALDLVEARGYGPVTLLGICSGAYLGLQTAVADGRVAGLVAANLYRLVWDPKDSVEQALRFANRAIGAAVTRLFTRARLTAILSGQRDLRPAIRHACKRLQRGIEVATMNWSGAFGPRGGLYVECMRRFGVLRARNVRTVLGYSRGDDGLNEIEDYFGRGGRRLAAYPNVSVAVIDRCDHNFTPPRASDWLLDHVEKVVAATREAAR